MKPDLTAMPLPELLDMLATLRRDKRCTLRELERKYPGDRRGLLDDLRDLNVQIAKAERVLLERGARTERRAEPEIRAEAERIDADLRSQGYLRGGER